MYEQPTDDCLMGVVNSGGQPSRRQFEVFGTAAHRRSGELGKMKEGYLCVCGTHKQAHKIGQSLPTPVTDVGQVKDVDVV